MFKRTKKSEFSIHLLEIQSVFEFNLKIKIMRKSTFTLLLASFFLCLVQLHAQSFNITNYGAVGDGTTLNTFKKQ
jgi:hypothetical protein